MSSKSTTHITSPRRDRVIEHPLTLEMVEPLHRSVHAALRFDPADPYAVSVVFSPAERPNVWTFGRELLSEGVFSPAGGGDIRVWPCLNAAGQATVVLELLGNTGEILMEMPSRAVLDFIAAVEVAVPRGTESLHVDVPDDLGSLFV